VITLNEEENIAACLDSLVSQDYPRERYEILVVDASQDATPEIVKRYPSVRYLRSEKGFSRQKNAGLSASVSELIAFTDADCIAPPEWLRTIAGSLSDPSVDGIGGNAFSPPGSGYFARCAAAIGHPAGGSLGFDANVRRSPRGIEFIAGCNAAFRRSALEAVGGFDPGFNDGGEDVDISRRLKRHGCFLDYAPGLSVYHKPRPSLGHYLKWNIGVGATKFNLQRPGLLRILLQPFFLAWPVLGLAGAAVLTIRSPWLGAALLALGWLGYLGALYAFTRPYPLLLRRRSRAGLGLISVVTIVPALVFARQVCINLGQLKKWLKVRREARAGADTASRES
jgi:cellulose synthase/poly-beta-1,6-N-acetylglucosamine synthase-like glycosyltransferase